jgi:hypothetical protein
MASVALCGSPLQKIKQYWWDRPSFRDPENCFPTLIDSDPTAVISTASL